MKRSWNKVSAFVCTVYFLSLALVPADALAVMDGTTNALSINANSLQPATVNCDSFCPTIVAGLNHGNSTDATSYTTSTISSHEVNTSGGVGWSPADDAWCALHGTVTNAQTGPPNPMPSPIPSSTSTCNIPLYPGDTSCAQANTGLLACKYYGSQIVPQCMAYEACSTANGWDVTMLALDAVAAVSCAVPCFYPEATTAVCTVAGVAASLTELIGVACEQHDPVEEAIEDTMSAVGLVGAGGTMVAGTVNQTGSWLNGAKGAGNNTGATAGRVLACAAMVMYVGTAVMRAIAINNMSNTKNSACSTIQSLQSAATVAAPGGTPDLNYGNYTPTNGSVGAPAGSNSLGGAYGGGTGTTQVATPNGTLTCVEQNGLQQCTSSSSPAASVLASTDGGFLSNSGMDKLVAPQAKGINTDGLMKKFNQGGAGAMMAAAMGDGADTAGGQALQNMANQMQKHPDELPGFNIGGSVYAGGGHGGGGGQTSAAKPMFGMAAGGGLAASGDSMAFDKTKKAAQVFDEGDIWHEGYKGTIFDIVTNKLSTTRDRIDKEDWQTPLNRALMGLKPLPKDKP